MTAPRPDRSVVALLAIVLLMATGLSLFYLSRAHALAGETGFPLDDSWIHLQFAKNLATHGAFSYYRDQMITSGSTAPLFTVLLAAGFLISANATAIACTLGIIAFLGSIVAVFRSLLISHHGSVLAAAAGASLTACEPRLVYAAVSGMETTLFIGLLFAMLAAYRSRQDIFFGVAFGLAVWTRPEALLAGALIVADAAYQKWGPRHEMRKRRPPAVTGSLLTGRGVAIAAVFVVAYAVFNLALSGSLLPNTYAAKTRYYAGSAPDFFHDAGVYLLTGHMLPVALLAGIGMLVHVIRLFRRQAGADLFRVGFPVLLVVAYGRTIPFLYQEGRYLMPALPFLIALAVDGAAFGAPALARRLRLASRPRRAAVAGTAAVMICAAFFTSSSVRKAEEYAEQCVYIHDRQVATARWIRDHLPPDAVVGTHDIGAIAFLSERKVADMVGLVSPEMIRSIGSFDGLRRFLASKHVTHLAVMRNWFEIANQTPLFHTDERYPEVMEVFPFDPVRIAFTPQNVTRVSMAAEEMLKSGSSREAARLLEVQLRTEQSSSRLFWQYARAAAANGQNDLALRALSRALQLRPSYPEALDFRDSLLHTRELTGIGHTEEGPRETPQ